MLRLYSDGPSYHGIFRKSANHAKKIQLKSAIEEGLFHLFCYFHVCLLYINIGCDK